VKQYPQRLHAQREFYSKKVWVFGKVTLFDFCWTAERWM